MVLLFPKYAFISLYSRPLLLIPFTFFELIMKTYFLPVGLLISLIISLVIPTPGVYLKELGLIPWCVVIIFFVNGYQTELKELPKSKSFVYTLLVTSFICLIISPIIGMLTASALQLGLGLTLGLLVKSLA